MPKRSTAEPQGAAGLAAFFESLDKLAESQLKAMIADQERAVQVETGKLRSLRSLKRMRRMRTGDFKRPARKKKPAGENGPAASSSQTVPDWKRPDKFNLAQRIAFYLRQRQPCNVFTIAEALGEQIPDVKSCLYENLAHFGITAKGWQIK